MSNKKRKPKYRLIIVLCLLLFGLIFFLMLQIPTKNIFVHNNKMLSDQEIIEQVGLEDYPNLYIITKKEIIKEGLKNIFIKEIEVKKRNFSEIHLYVVENRPLFFVDYDNETVLLDGKTIKQKFDVPILINYVPDFVYLNFIEKMGSLVDSVTIRISEIQYAPNEVDEERFLLYMIDGNYVYLNIDTFLLLNDYLAIMTNIFNNYGTKTGVLNLDAGGYFNVFE